MVSNSKPNSDLVLESSLQFYFYDQLQEVNSKSTRPLPTETIYYSSIVMDRFGESSEFFEVVEGKVREKILGMKLLEANNMSKEQQKRTLKDIGDTALLVCGYFSDSLNKKIVDTRYYQELGQIAYQRLDSFIPSFYEVNSFYKLLSSSFESVTMLMGIVSKRMMSQSLQDEAILVIGDPSKLKVS
ncbi:MAG: hypothetical protein Fur0010_16070 [Bdellovibrio sp.]